MENYPIVQMIMTNNLCYRIARKYSGGRPTGIMIHSNGVQGVPATSWPVRWNNPITNKAPHAFVDERSIVQALPWSIQGWHAGGSANATHLSVETSEPIVDTLENFAATWSRLVWLAAYWCKLYNLTEKNIIDHSEGHDRGIASNHGDVRSDPGYTRVPEKRGQGYFTRNGKTMNDFRQAVAQMLDTNEIPPILRTLMRGDVGEDVRLCQQRLNAKGASLSADGIFGPLTEAAVKAFQARNGLASDGIVGPKTWEALLSGEGTNPPPIQLPPTVRRGDTGEAVRLCQRRLNLKGASLSADGIFGALTEAAVKAFQARSGLISDGIVGPDTWAALLDDDIGNLELPPPPQPLPGSVRRGDKGDTVRLCQQKLIAKGAVLSVDGIFGPLTEAAVRSFQARSGLAVDGIVGVDTWAALLK